MPSALSTPYQSLARSLCVLPPHLQSAACFGDAGPTSSTAKRRPEIHQDARPVVLSQNLTILAESKQSIASYADNHNVWRMAAGILLAFVCFAKPATAKRLPLNP